MTTLKSNKGVARKISEDMATVANQGLGVENDSMIATKTNVKGNRKAKNSLQRTTSSVSRLAAAFKKDSKKISLLGNAFDAVDTEFKHRLKKNF